MAQSVLRVLVDKGFDITDVWTQSLMSDRVYYYWDVRDANNATLMDIEPGSTGRGKGSQRLCIHGTLVDALSSLSTILERCFDYLRGSDPSNPKRISWSAIASISLVGVRKNPNNPAALDATVVLDKHTRYTLPNGTRCVRIGRISAHLFYVSTGNASYVECFRIQLHMPTFRFLFTDSSVLLTEKRSERTRRANKMLSKALERYERMGSSSYRMPTSVWRTRLGQASNPMGASINTLFPQLCKSLNASNPETEWIIPEQYVVQQPPRAEGEQPQRHRGGRPSSQLAIQVTATLHLFNSLLRDPGAARDQNLSNMLKHHTAMIAFALDLGEPHAGIWLALSVTKASKHESYWDGGRANRLLERLASSADQPTRMVLDLVVAGATQQLSLKDALLNYGFVAGSAGFMMHDAPLFMGLLTRDDDKDSLNFDEMLGMHLPESISGILRIIPHVCLTDDRTRVAGQETLVPYICDPYSDGTPLPRMQGWRALLRKIMAITVSEGPTNITGGTYVLPLKISARDSKTHILDLKGIFPLYPNYPTEPAIKMLDDDLFSASKLRVIKWRTFLPSEIIEYVFRRYASANNSASRNMQTMISFVKASFQEVDALCNENGCLHSPLAWLHWMVDHRGAQMAQNIGVVAFLRHLREMGMLLRSRGLRSDQAAGPALSGELRKLIATPLRDYIIAQKMELSRPSVNQIVEKPGLGLIEAVASWTGPFPRIITALIVECVDRTGFGILPKVVIDRLREMGMPADAQVEHAHHLSGLVGMAPSDAELTHSETVMLRLCTHWAAAVRRHIDLVNKMIDESRARMPPGASLPLLRVNGINDLVKIRMDLLVGTWRNRNSMVLSVISPPMPGSVDGDLSSAWIDAFGGALYGSPFIKSERDIFEVEDYVRLYTPTNMPTFELSPSQKKWWNEAKDALNEAARFGTRFATYWSELACSKSESWTQPIWFTITPYDTRLYFWLDLLETGAKAYESAHKSWLKASAAEKRRVVSVIDDPSVLETEQNPTLQALMVGLLRHYERDKTYRIQWARTDAIQQIRCWRNPLNRLLILALTNRRMTLVGNLLELHNAMEGERSIGGITGHIDDTTYELAITNDAALMDRSRRVQDATYTACMLSESQPSPLTSSTPEGRTENLPGTLALMTALQARSATMIYGILNAHHFDRLRIYYAQQRTVMPSFVGAVNDASFPSRVLSIYELASTWLIWEALISPPSLPPASESSSESNNNNSDDDDGSGSDDDAEEGRLGADLPRGEAGIDAFILSQLTTAVDTAADLEATASGESSSLGGGLFSTAKAVADVNLYRMNAATARARPVKPSLIRGLVGHARLAALPLRARNEEVSMRLSANSRDNEREPTIHEALHMAQREVRLISIRKQEDWEKIFNTRLSNTVRSVALSQFHARSMTLARITFDTTRSTTNSFETLFPPDMARLAILHSPIVERLKRAMESYTHVLESIPSAHDAAASVQTLEETALNSNAMEISRDNKPTTDAAALTTREAVRLSASRLAAQEVTRGAVEIFPQWHKESAMTGTEAASTPPPRSPSQEKEEGDDDNIFDRFPELPDSDEVDADVAMMVDNEGVDTIPQGTELPTPLELASEGGGRLTLAHEEEMLLRQAMLSRRQQSRELHLSSLYGLIATSTPLVLLSLCANRIGRFCTWLQDERTIDELPRDPWLQSIFPQPPVEEPLGLASNPATIEAVQAFFKSHFFWIAWRWSERLFEPLAISDRVRRAINQFVKSVLLVPYEEPILTEIDLARYVALNTDTIPGSLQENAQQLMRQMQTAMRDPSMQSWLERPVYWSNPSDISKIERRWKASTHRVSTFTLEKLAKDPLQQITTAVPSIITRTRSLLTNMSRRYHAAQPNFLLTKEQKIPINDDVPTDPDGGGPGGLSIIAVTPYLVRNYWIEQFMGRTAMASLMSTFGEGDPNNQELPNIFTKLLTRFVPAVVMTVLETHQSPFDATTATTLGLMLSNMATSRSFFDTSTTPPWYNAPAYAQYARSDEVQILAYILFGIEPIGNEAGRFKQAMLGFKRRYLNLKRAKEEREHNDPMDTTK